MNKVEKWILVILNSFCQIPLFCWQKLKNGQKIRCISGLCGNCSSLNFRWLCFFLESEILSLTNINTKAQAKTPWLEYLVVDQELPISA